MKYFISEDWHWRQVTHRCILWGMQAIGRLILTGLLVLSAGIVDAQQLSLTVGDGRVSINASGASLQQVLAEWARVGGVTVVGSEKIGGAPVTLTLSDVPERQAFDILLRDVSGYLLAARPDGVRGNSIFDRVLILPASTAPTPAAQPALAVPGAGTFRGLRPVAPPSEPVEQEETPAEDAVPQAPINAPPMTGVEVVQPDADAGGPRPPTGRAFPTFPVPVGSGQPGGIVPVPPPNPYGPNTTRPQTGPLLPGSTQQPR